MSNPSGPNQFTPQRPYTNACTHGDDNTALLAAISALRDDLKSQLSEFKLDMRREADQYRMDMHTRLTQLENWRISEAQRVADDRGAMQKQISESITSAVRETSTQRSTVDGRAIAALQTFLYLAVSAILSYVFTHVH